MNPKQCDVLDAVLNTLKDYFNGSGCVKKAYLDKSTELVSLRHALSLYTKNTDSLIKTFVKTQTCQVSFPEHPAPGEGSVGEVSIQVELTTHPGTGEHKVTVVVIAANNLQWDSTSVFRPFVEVHLIGPHLSDKKRVYSTKAKAKTLSPKYNETCSL